MKAHQANTAGLMAAATTLVLDQSLKDWAHSAVSVHGTIAVAPVFNIVAVQNSGISFGMAQGAAPILPVAAALGISVMLVLWLLRSRSWLGKIGLGLAIGGALGNVFDRVLFGFVRDYLDAYWRTYHWPAFNLADAAIVVGLGCFLLADLRTRKLHEVK